MKNYWIKEKIKFRGKFQEATRGNCMGRIYPFDFTSLETYRGDVKWGTPPEVSIIITVSSPDSSYRQQLPECNEIACDIQVVETKGWELDL